MDEFYAARAEITKRLIVTHALEPLERTGACETGEGAEPYPWGL
jgi:hypothetical protein